MANKKKSKKSFWSDYKKWRDERPDITLLLDIIMFICVVALFYTIAPFVSSLFKNPLYTEEQLLKAAQIPNSKFTIAETTQITNELKALQDHAKYFDSDPYSPENIMEDIQKGNVFLPIISFILIYFVPPLIVLYIIWFCITYWKYVFAAIWGWFVMIYSYSTKLIECQLAKKWYIRMVTGWKKCKPNPTFSDYFNRWWRKYVEIPIYKEKLKYVKRYYAAKEKYYTIPKNIYIDQPREIYGVKGKYLKKIYLDRTKEVFMKSLASEDALNALRNKGRQWSGDDYMSETKSGAKCWCPGSKTSEDDDDDDKHECQVHSNQSGNYFAKFLLFSVLGGVSLYAYSRAYGIPKWLIDLEKIIVENI